MTKKRPNEFEYASHVSYTRALEEYCNALEKKKWAGFTDDERLSAAWTDGSYGTGFNNAENKLMEKNK